MNRFPRYAKAGSALLTGATLAAVIASSAHAGGVVAHQPSPSGASFVAASVRSGVRSAPTPATDLLAASATPTSSPSSAPTTRPTATSSFLADNSKEALITGVAQPNAAVAAFLGERTQAFTEADDEGNYTLEIPAANEGGMQSGAVYELKGGYQGPSTPISIDYGDEVKITTPGFGARHAGGAIAVTGTGTPGGIVTIRDNGSTTATTVETNGTWSVSLSLDAHEHRLSVEQLSRGDNKTSATTIVNNGADDSTEPTLSSPSSGSTVVAPRPCFTGSGQPTATITLSVGSTVIGHTTVPASGAWSLTPTSDLPLGVSSLTITQTVAGKVQSITASLNRLADHIPFSVTSPVDGSGLRAGKTTFTGRATPDTHVVATDRAGTRLGEADADASGDWRLTSDVAVDVAGYNFTFVGALRGVSSNLISLRLTPVVSTTPVAITSVTNKQTYRPGLNVLSGTGLPGAAISVVNTYGGIFDQRGTTTVRGDGTWSLPAQIWGPKSDYQFWVYQTDTSGGVSSTTLQVLAPANQGIRISKADVTRTTAGGTRVTFGGQATAFSTVKVTSTSTGEVYQTVEANALGQWTATANWGGTATNVVTFVATTPAAPTSSWSGAF